MGLANVGQISDGCDSDPHESLAGVNPVGTQHLDTPRPRARVQVGVTNALHWDRDEQGFLGPSENERYRSPNDLSTPLNGGYRVSYAGGINTLVFMPGEGRGEQTRRNLDFETEPSFADRDPLV